MIMAIVNDGGSFSPSLGFGVNSGGSPAARVGYNNALFVSNVPLDYLKGSSTGAGASGGGGGHFAIEAESGALAGVAANASVFSFRWVNAYLVAAITKLSMWWVTTTAFTVAQLLNHGVFIARSFTVADSVGTDVTPLAGQQMKRTSMKDSLASKILIATTAALTAGTRTLDTQPIAGIGAWSGAQGNALERTVLLDNIGERYPVVLAANEGLVIINKTLMGAAGVIKLGVEMEWAEIDPTSLT